ncbi:hypothetical protein [Streptomyces luteireticuli]|uniref:Uncharacterized protein n=1 Tax=Streptomyces luteireticuli TaxID=173858 RepID=A0ABN0Z093_9ACTN
MTSTVRLAEFRAERSANALLARIRAASASEQLVFVQALILDHALAEEEFSANDFRDALPDLRHGILGAAIRGLAASGHIVNTGRYVPSTLKTTHGHRIAVYRLASAGTMRAAA